MSLFHPTSQYLRNFPEIIYSSLNSERVLLNTKRKTKSNQNKRSLDMEWKEKYDHFKDAQLN